MQNKLTNLQLVDAELIRRQQNLRIANTRLVKTGQCVQLDNDNNIQAY